MLRGRAGLFVDFEGFLEPFVDLTVNGAYLLDFCAVCEAQHPCKDIHQSRRCHLYVSLEGLPCHVDDDVGDIIAQAPDCSQFPKFIHHGIMQFRILCHAFFLHVGAVLDEQCKGEVAVLKPSILSIQTVEKFFRRLLQQWSLQAIDFFSFFVRCEVVDMLRILFSALHVLRLP